MKELNHAIANLVANNDLHYARRWYHTCLQFVNDDEDVQLSQADERLIRRKREVLIQGFGRAKGLLDAALEWGDPGIQRGEENALALVRGELWRHVMAYSGWELLAKSVLWDGKAVHSAIHRSFDKLLDAQDLLQPPHASRAEAPQPLKKWLQADARGERCLPTFLGLS